MTNQDSNQCRGENWYTALGDIIVLTWSRLKKDCEHNKNGVCTHSNKDGLQYWRYTNLDGDVKCLMKQCPYIINGKV